MRFYVLDGGGPKDSENTLNSFMTKHNKKVFWQIGADMPKNIDQGRSNSFEAHPEPK